MITRFAVLLLSLLASSPMWALEGGSTSRDAVWKSVRHQPSPSASERQEELARSAAIQAEIAKLNKRLGNQPSAAATKALHAKLEEVIANYGWSPELELVLAFVQRNQFSMVRMRFLPNYSKHSLNCAMIWRHAVPTLSWCLWRTPQVSSHLLVDGVDADHEYAPGWTKMMLQFLENDIEIVDTTAEFRQAADSDMLVNWVNDFHTGGAGRRRRAAVAERLQRYAFARELAENTSMWTVSEGEKVGCHFPQRNLVVNRAFKQINKDKVPEGVKSWKVKHPRKAMILQDGLSPSIEQNVKGRKFNYMDLKFSGNRNAIRRSDLVFIGDSQLHSAVYGTGLPEFYMSAIGGDFRWGSKSWGGFSLPEIYLDVVSDSDVQPRVVVASFLPKYFWTKKDNKGNIAKTKYGPKAMPGYKGGSTKAAASADEGPIDVTVKIVKLSKKATEDPTTLDYDDALMHVAAQVTKGPMKGKEIGLRYWILNDGKWTKADKQVKVGQTLNLKLIPFTQATSKEKGLGQHQVFDDTEQDLTVPIYWATGGALSPKSVL